MSAERTCVIKKELLNWPSPVPTEQIFNQNRGEKIRIRYYKHSNAKKIVLSILQLVSSTHFVVSFSVCSYISSVEALHNP